MYDSRELRPGEINLAACQEQGVTVVGTNEDHPKAPIFRYCGLLVARQLLECGLEIQSCAIGIIGDNFFTPHIVNTLTNLGAQTIVFQNWDSVARTHGDLDALVFADYCGSLGQPPANLSQGTDPKQILLQFAGGCDISSFLNAGWQVTPPTQLPTYRMFQTLAQLGIRPVVELHAAGLKAAELTLRGKSTLGTPFDGLTQPVADSHSTSISWLADAYSC